MRRAVLLVAVAVAAVGCGPGAGSATPVGEKATGKPTQVARTVWTLATYTPAPAPTPSATPDAWTVACQQNPAGTATAYKPERSSVSGRAVSVAPDSIVASTPDQGCIVLQLSAYKIWEDLWVKDIPIEVGDDVFAADTPFGPKLYVNIVNLIGVISNVRREGDLVTFDLEYGPRYGSRGGKDTIKVDGRASISGSGPTEGQRGQVVGRRLKDGSVVGVTVFYLDGS